MPGTVIQAGGGRGFVIAVEEAYYVITAAHCLGVLLPPPHPAAYPRERTSANFLGTLSGPRTVWAECAFVDPVADIAVFREPDSQELSHEAEAYRALIEREATPFAIGRLEFRRTEVRLSDGTVISGRPEATADAMLLSLDGDWFPCRIESLGRSLWIVNAARPIVGGMSGSPIVLPGGSAIGVVCVSSGREGGPNPLLPASLPAWLADQIRRSTTGVR